ncbi:hypothetical protein B0H15DRAFT_901138, partial [Mycena belliarum]
QCVVEVASRLRRFPPGASPRAQSRRASSRSHRLHAVARSAASGPPPAARQRRRGRERRRLFPPGPHYETEYPRDTCQCFVVTAFLSRVSEH